MKKLCAFGLVFLFLLETLYANSDSSQYKQNIIASMGNRPDFHFDADMKDLIISIHKRIQPEEFRRESGWSIEKYNQCVAFLESKGFIQRVRDEVRISCMVINDEDGKLLSEYAEPISQAIADSILKMKGKFQEEYSSMRLAKDHSFDSMAFFLLSDVLLDNWQIHKVEDRFLKAERPLRNGKNYYYSFIENLYPSREAFGIYGNQPSKTYSIYGNNRGNIENSEIDARIPSFPILSRDDNEWLRRMADNYAPVLLDILEANRNYMNDVFKRTGYANEIRFEEFFIWWYHFIYSRATDILAKKGALAIPESGNFFYRYGD